MDSQRAGGQDFTQECAGRTGALQVCAPRQPQPPACLAVATRPRHFACCCVTLIEDCRHAACPLSAHHGFVPALL